MTNRVVAGRALLRRWIEDFPALVVVVSLALLSLMPILRYQEWAYVGQQLGNRSYRRAMQAWSTAHAFEMASEESWPLASSYYLLATDELRQALVSYERPAIRDWPPAGEVRLRLAELYLVRASFEREPQHLREALKLFWRLGTGLQGAYRLEGLAGLWALGEFLTAHDRRAIEPAVSRVALAEVEARPNDLQRRADARRFHSYLFRLYLLLGDDEALQRTSPTVLALSDPADQQLVRGWVQDVTGEPAPGARVFVQGIPAGVTDATGYFSATLVLPEAERLRVYAALPSGVVRGLAMPIVADIDELVIVLRDAPPHTAQGPLPGQADSASVIALLDQAGADAPPGERDLAASRYRRTVTLALTTDDWYVNNSVCWRGSIDGFAEIVIESCNHAVALAPSDHDIIDSRGLARALTGDTSGAIADFTYFVERTTQIDRREQRQRWIEELAAGRNPFDRATLEMLRSQ